MKRKAGQNVAFLASSALLGRAAGLVLAPAIARMSGTQALGAFQLALATSSFAFILAAFGLAPLAVRAISRDPSAEQAIFLALLRARVKTTVGAALAAGVLAVAAGYNEFVIELLGVLLVGVCGLVASDSCSAVLQARGAGRAILMLAAAASGAYVALGVGALALGFGVSGVAIANSSASVLAGAAAGYVVMRSYKRVSVPRDERHVSLRGGIPFFVATSGSYLMNRADVFVLAAFVPLSEIGVYVAGYAVLDGLLVLPNAVGQAVYPDLVRERSRGQRPARALVWGYVARAGGAAAVLSVMVCVGSEAIVSALFGRAFASSGRVLEVVAPSLAFSTVAAVLGRAAFAGGGQAAIARITAAAALGNIAANCVIVPMYGIAGASAVTLATFGASAVAHWWYCGRLGSAPPTVLGVGLLGALLAGVVVGFEIPLDSVFAAPIGGGITAAGAAVMVRLSPFPVDETAAGATEFCEAHDG